MLDFFKYLEETDRRRVPLLVKIRHCPDEINDNDLVVHGDFRIFNGKIDFLPENMVIMGDCDFYHSSFKNPFPRIGVWGQLNLCFTNITYLPDNLTLGSLYLDNSRIKKLPKNLMVLNELSIVNTEIDELPDDIYVGKLLVLNKYLYMKYGDDYLTKRFKRVVTPYHLKR